MDLLSKTLVMVISAIFLGFLWKVVMMFILLCLIISSNIKRGIVKMMEKGGEHELLICGHIGRFVKCTGAPCSVLWFFTEAIAAY